MIKIIPRKIAAPLFLIISLIALLPITGVFNHEIQLSLNGNESVTLSVGDTYKELGCEATYIEFRSEGDVSPWVKVSGEVDTSTPGTYSLIYTITIEDLSESITRTVIVKDTTLPTLEAPETVSALVGTPIEKVKVNYTAKDNFDGDITDKVERQNDKNNKSIILSVSDSSGNEIKKTISVKYFEDHTPPVISLSGGNSTYIKKGATFSDPGYSASDAVWGNLTKSVKKSGSVDTSTPGSYTIEYSVTDGSGNTAYAKRTVTVFVPWNGGTVSIPSNGHTIYLTFDDGPGRYTAQILDILASYNVKATFFVTNQFAAYQHLIAREAAEGHKVAAHTYSHNFAIYSSVDSYFNDLEAINNVIEKQTGFRTNLIRFPGGSSNTTSRRYATGIMTALTNEVQNRGYVYFDWNVSSGDATGSSSVSSIIRSVTSALRGGDYVVLMHDINGQNIKALPQIIEYGLAHGYTFRALTENSPTCHHGVQN